MPLVECVPNFSEGRDAAVLQAIEAAITGVAGVHLLDVHRDRWHHRAVFTFIGAPDPVVEAAYQAMAAAAARIDLARHVGEHPRLGATDVVPFVPLQGITLTECAQLARRLAARAGHELGIPIFLYGEAASAPDRRSLSSIRRRCRTPGDAAAFPPDFGPRQMHPRAGATAVGARPVLVAYNVLLDTDDRLVAEAIAREIRAAGGGLPAVEAKGFLVDGKAQVSTNLLDIDRTPPAVVFQEVVTRAGVRGVDVIHSEIVGLIPERAVVDAGARALKLVDAVSPHLLEPRIRSVAGGGEGAWLDRLAAPGPAPGAGSAAAHTGAVAAAVVEMVAGATRARTQNGAVAEECRRMVSEANGLRVELERLAGADAEAYRAVLTALRLPQHTAEERARRRRVLDEALAGAAEPPHRTAKAAARLTALAHRLTAIGIRSAVSDAVVAALLAHAVVKASALTVCANVGALSEPGAAAELTQEVEAVLAKAEGHLAAAVAAG